MEADGLRRRAADLLEQAKAELDVDRRATLIELAVAFLAKARELERQNKSN
jgi:hypothetical protein